MNITLDTLATGNTSATGGASADRAKDAKLADAAQQFESMMLQEMLKPMRSGQGSWGDEEKSDDSASDTISSFGTEAMAKAISKGGGLGIARQVMQKITLEHQKSAGKEKP